MRKAISKAIFIKNIVFYSVLSCVGVIALATIAKELLQSVAAGEEIFIPGIAALILAVLLVLLFAVTRVIKYTRLLGDRTRI
jgi:hypothetical protein